MKYGFLLFTIVFFSIHTQAQRLPNEDPNPWHVVFEDDFFSLDNNRWVVQNNVVHGNPRDSFEEPQVYIPSNVYTLFGQLVLKTCKIDSPITCPGWDTCMYANRNHFYTSGEIISRNKYQYGYYEIRVDFPSGYGLWPAFWLQADHNSSNNPWYNEIDILEGDCSEIDSMTCNYWYSSEYPVYDTWQSDCYKYHVNDIRRLHWYGVLWTPHSITWYFDRKPVRRTSNNFMNEGIQHPMNVIVNMAVFPYRHTDSTLTASNNFPLYTHVDKINVYQIDCQDSNAIVNEITDWSSYNYLVKKSISLSNSTQLPVDEETSLYASDFIELKNGFTVPIGTSFYAGGCDYCK